MAPPNAFFSDGQEGYAAHTNPSLVTHHRGHERPAVCLRVIHFHRAEVGLSVVTPHSVETATVCNERDTAPPGVHRDDQVPLIRHGAVDFSDTEEARTIVASTDEHLAAQRGCSVAAALVEHAGDRVPGGRVMVVVLHLQSQRAHSVRGPSLRTYHAARITQTVSTRIWKPTGELGFCFLVS